MKEIENDPLTDSMEIWHLLSKVFHNGKKRLEQELDKIGVKPTEIRVLYSISQDKDTNMNSLASQNDVTGPWITGLVDDLEEKGYVTKTRSTTDRRVVKVSITENGSEILKRGIVIYNRLIDLALKGLSESDLVEFTKILSSIEKSLGEN
ncbi:MarR family winged helix-turn-helix transcriptional regulator [Oxyplasma meridianum]|uniref:MarR family winged helix-turn-helix transcriptional regulator n=1 Tax=Oxyplasma meridianum TaxID=3073602 RepID=A0AAX4NJA3_9ARCH